MGQMLTARSSIRRIDVGPNQESYAIWVLPGARDAVREFLREMGDCCFEDNGSEYKFWAWEPDGWVGVTLNEIVGCNRH